MKKIVVIVTFLLIFKPVLPVVGYLVNYNYIITELCINKNDKATRCNGTCQLKKELAKASDLTEGSTTDKKSSGFESETLYLTSRIQALLIATVSHFQNAIGDHYHSNYKAIVGHSIFHPPANC